ncbi:TIGR02281 family clan AA aspartic protease [Chitinibacter bivalviorum]|uniref:TIGR02281 family clan AA aspartic protease n=1 Tax=Chitinibacter bivalviorum TaxID=2739434 RepID=A0A7H9BHJ3_9NEIS|nr:TIGR02281 family clan AA aspartic protease [Chitinibacter bivalviorum]QLG87802.1 TIGR02281 family clan AA aspartic protease [Chitinibacter bivalviorum]
MRIILALLALCYCSLSFADDIVLIGTMGNKGVFQINGQKKTLQAGQESGAFKVLAIQGETATVSSGSQQRQLQLGQGYVAQTSENNENSGGSLVLSPDAQGHYMADLFINQVSRRGLVDTGATHLSMTRNVAEAMRISYQSGQLGRSQTANGVINAWLIRIPQVKIGNIMVYDVPAVVRDANDNSPILIGTSVLNRFQMKRDQDLMILSKKAY